MELLPESIGPYRLLAKLGQGGMGAVYRALNQQVGRLVALKVLRPELTVSPECVTRFLREARAAADLRHENLVRVLDAGAYEGRYFIAMELVEGGSLARYLEEYGTVEESEGLEWLRQAALGLSAAHARGLVHRDIKPENLLLDLHRRIRIVDFGLALESAPTMHLTATGLCLGTPMYMSPEQADGEKADARSDLYALGVTFYKAFAGRPPFSSDTVLNLLFKHKFEAVPDPRQLRPTLSADAANLLLTLLAKHREERPPSARAVAEMIERLRIGQPIPPPPGFRSRLPAPIWPVNATPAPARPPARNLEVYVPNYAAPAPASARESRAGLVLGALVAGALAVAVVFWGLRQWNEPAPTPKVQAGPLLPHSGASTRTSILETPARLDAEGERRRRELVDEAEKLEARGEESRALADYSAAAALEDSPSLQNHIRRLRYRLLIREAERQEKLGQYEAALNKAREAHGLQDTSLLLENLRRKRELQLEEEQAERAEREGRLVGAVQHYEAAAKLADEAAVMNRLLERASECRRQGFLAQARQAEGRGDWSDAATALAQALALKDDPLVRVRRAEMVRRAEADEAWRFHLEAGERELAGGNCARAQEHFRQALKIKPQSVEPQEKLRHAEARLQIEQGDVARGRGDLESARRLYEAAQVQCPALRPEVERRLVDLARQVAGGETLVAEVERLAKEGRASEALARLGRTSGELPPKLFETLRDGLAELQAVEIRLENLRPILAKAETALNEGIAAEKDSELQELPANVAALEKDRATLVASSRGRFLGRDLAALKTSGEESLKLALRVSEALSQARELSDAKAREAGQFVGLRWGFIRLGRKEDRVKEERLTKLAVVLGGLAEEAKLLGR